MTGFPQLNYPSFTTWASKLRGIGFGVVSPHEEDPSGPLAPSEGTTDATPTLIRNLESLARCHGIALLPNKWTRSPGVRHEIETAHRLDMPVAPASLWLAAGFKQSQNLFEVSA
jgi:hypothetical protein